MVGTTRTRTWAQSSLRRRLLLAVSLPLLTVVLLTAGTFLLRQYALDTRAESVRALENELALAQLLTATDRAHRAAAMFSENGDEAWRTAYDEAAVTRDTHIRQLAGRLDQQHHDELVAAVDDHDSQLRSLLVGPDGPAERNRLLAAADADARALENITERVTAEEARRYDRRRREADRLNVAISTAGVIIGVVGVVGGLLAVWFLSQTVVGRLKRLQTNAERLATGERLLEDPGGHDEVGVLARIIAGAHATIREKDALLDLALEAGRMVVFEVRPDGTVALRGEPTLLSAVGIAEGATTMPLEDLQARLVADGVTRVPGLPNGDLPVRTPDGRTRWLEVRSHEQPPRGRSDDGDGAKTLVGVVADVTVRREAYAALQDAKDTAERASRTKDEFLSRMSHELRTPLNAVLGFAQLLEMEDLDGQQRESVEHILKGGRHLLALVNDVLDLARVESGRLSLSVESTRLVELVEEAIQLTLPLARQYRIRLSAEPDEAAVHAMVDRRRMKQVLLNLLSNAIKYNRPGGSVRVGWAICDGVVRVTVSDTGIGIDDRQRSDLFQPFARSDDRTLDIEGTGLGLAVSRSLIEAMGGSLVLLDTGETGSTFAVELPEASDTTPELDHVDRADSTVEQLRSLGPLQVLHVEDNAANRRLVEELLRRAGSAAPMVAETGRDGVELATRHRPDIILLDRHLPDMLGEDVLRELRADERTADTPVVVVSADALDRSSAALRRSGADAFVTKPIDAEEFWRTLGSVLAHGEERRE